MSFHIRIENVMVEVHEAGTDRLLQRQRLHNDCLNGGVRQLRNVVFYPSMPGLSIPRDGWTPNYIALGSNGDATTLGMTGCQTEVFRKEITSRIPLATGGTFYLYVAAEECNGSGNQALREMTIHTSLLDADAWMRTVFSLITKNAGITLSLSWDMTFANA